MPGDARKGLAERVPDDLGGDAVVGGATPVDDDQGRSGTNRACAQGARWFDGERRPDGEQEVAGRNGPLGAGEHLRGHGLPEHRARRLQDPATSQALRHGLARTDPGYRVCRRRPAPALDTDDLVHRPVQLDHPIRRRACLLVQAVRVLGHDRRVNVRVRQGGHGEMAGVRLGSPDRVLVPRLPVAAAKLGIGEERLVSVLVLRPWVQGPGSRRSAEVRDARIGRDSRTAEHHQATYPVGPPH